MILDGKSLSQNIKTQLKKEVSDLLKKLEFTPKLATILVGDDPASKVYVAMKQKACRQIGLEPLHIALDKCATTNELLTVIEKLNKDPEVCGIMLQHPTPAHIDEAKCFNAIKESKDVDGLNTASFGKIAMNQPSFAPATPLGIMMLLESYNIDVSGKHALVIGRSQILGKPVASMLLNKNATVTIAHSKTKNLNKLLSSADIIVACVGKPHFIKASQLKKGVIIIDAGYNKGNIGDVDLSNADKIASFYTPVPGGVGPMTISALLTQAVMSAKSLVK